ncbi:hypothetical protein HYH02_002454 [Chlamydomonas schloesseri]|uniref:Protein kinase domain-containing protein n=1 Tax=Chlamydomonas schloesseri TaxID=2026947 RepID=A0A835WTH4_9CHLO|nr:hypothetical protein HYH02_002454 [Chlamydomonas schloesseri]|eukprot:KAG2453124.1 hypothetical protein HYH02_002454 [Chlamydomonas schloesseri]
MGNLAGRVRLLPGTQLAFRWLELVNYVEEMGPAMLIVAASPGARVTYDHTVLRRRAGFSGLRYLADIQALARANVSEGPQVAFSLPRFCYNVTREASQQCASDLVYVVDVSAQLGPSESAFFAAGVPLGRYLVAARETALVIDHLVKPECVQSLSEGACVAQLLKLLDIEPVIIKTKPSDSNLVKIVASLAILAVSVLLFLYFRRHYKSYQQRRARRMRRLKEALGMGPEAHGIMFNGLDGEEPDWQIMPMPVGYAAEENVPEPPMHQDSNIRNIIKDISNRPNRRIPEYGEGEEVRIDVDCPIAAEVGLRITADAAAAGGIRVANGVGGSGAGEDGSHRSAAGRTLTPQDGLGPLRGEGGVHASTDSAGGHAGVPPGHASIGSHVTSHRSGASSKSRVQGMAVGMDSATLPVMHGSGGAQAGTASPRLMPPSMALTTAGMEALLVTRAAAVGAVGGSGGTARAPGSDERAPGAPSDGPVGTATQAAGSSPAVTEATTTGTATPRRRAPGAATPGASEAAALPVATATPADANRAAVQFAAADITERVMKSKDSDSEGGRNGEEEEEVGGNPQVANLMDELEALRRDIMSGINDTQLQIMSVVGSGAFGTVYRGQWQGLEVAVKTVVFSASSENRKRALQEAALCQSINHRNIVATYAVDVQPLGAVTTPVLANPNARNSTLSNLLDWRLYIVQEYCDGGPLRKIVQSRYLQTDNGPNMPVICEVALELAQALAHLHSKNVIHGDLNPNNVLLKRDASSPIGFRVKMADFGLSVMVPLQKTHMSNLRLGTLYYIAPETCFRGQLGYAADVFSLGVMLWELYHGRLAGTRTPTGEPRYQPDFPDFPATCPTDYRKLAHRCLQKQPHNRLHSSQVVQRLHEMLANYKASGALGPPLPPLPVGGPDEYSAPMFAGTHAVNTPVGGPTPTESRHRPADAAAGNGQEIAPAESQGVGQGRRR